MKLSKRLALFLLLILVLALQGVLYISDSALVYSLEHKIKDGMLLFRGQRASSPHIAIIDIDEKSLSKLGQWPWSRDKIARILNNLSTAGVGIVGLDVVFAEEDSSSPHRVLKSIGMPYDSAPNYDEELADSLKNTPTITGYVFAMSDDDITPEGSPRTQAVIIERDKSGESSLPKPYRAILNTPLLQDSSYSSGYFNTIPDSDGVVRSVPLIMEFDGVLYPALSLEMVRLLLGENRIEVRYVSGDVVSIKVGELEIPTDRFGRMRLNYTGGRGSYPYISALDIFDGRFDREQIEGKILLLGTSSAGLLDLRSTPFESVFPGVEVHANALDNLLSQDFISEPFWALEIDLITIIVLPILGFFILQIPSALIGFLTMVVAGGSFLGAHYYLMLHEGIVINTLIPLFGLALLFFGGVIINYFYESRQKDLIKAKFAKKVSSAVVDELISSSSFELAGSEREITIFFSDVRDFTTISEKLDSPEALISLLNDYMTPMVDIITRHNGTVDKFIGDAVMAYWNAPKSVKAHADEALCAAIEQIEALTILNEDFAQKNRPLIHIGIGLNSGVCVVGEMGSLGRSDYTCIGDPVNLGSRIEGLCKGYGAQILLSEYTYELLENPDKYTLIEIDLVRVKGKEKAVRIYQCLGFKGREWCEIPEKFAEARDLYLAGEFVRAIDCFEKLDNQEGNKLYTLYISRCQHYIEYPPENFDGVFVYKTK
ncbi:MAG: CHASE2 domain-containing protein [Wolinella sp.]